MKSKERILSTLNHKSPDKIAIDFGGTPVTGIHALVIEKLRAHYGLEKRPVKVMEPYQFLGEVDNELIEAIGIDTIGISPKNNMFGYPNNNWKEFKTFWGQEVLVPNDFNTKIDKNGDLLMYPEGDMTVSPSAKMPFSSFFFDAIIRQQPIDDANLNPEDNLEEFKIISEEDLDYWEQKIKDLENTDKAIVANFGGTAIGDIALVPATFMKNPKGIRDVTEWYMSTLMRADYLHEIFYKQTNIVIENFKRLFKVVGNKIDVVFICGTDFGTQNSQFCSKEVFEELYAPYYRKMNNWVHSNTTWKTFKHSCGAVEPLMTSFIDSGFDIINPVQINATDMDPKILKEKYGKQLTFWGGGVDTQKMLPYGTPAEIEKQVLELCDIFSKDGGFVFNTVHNIQANTPIKNVVAIINAINKFDKS